MSEDSRSERKDWDENQPTEYGEQQRDFLSTLCKNGFKTYVGPYGLFGATEGMRSVEVIHRGMLRRWEISLSECDVEIASSFVSEFGGLVGVSITWLDCLSHGEAKAQIQGYVNSLE